MSSISRHIHTTMKTPASIVLILLFLGHFAYGQDVENTSYVDSNGDRVLRHELIIPALLEEVWNAFTTSEGLRSFVAPIASIELKIGGIWEASYNRQAVLGDPANIRNEIISYLPMEMLSIRIVQTPPGFPNPDVGKRLWTVLQFEEVESERVRVAVTMLGWPEGSEADAVYDLFDRGNAYTLRQLHRRFTQGPVDWDAQ